MKSIPVNAMIDNPDTGIAIEKLFLTEAGSADEEMINLSADGNHSHRHDSHSFYLLESGTVDVEIDFETYTVTPSTIIYIHPDQVHRTTSFNHMTVCSLAITDENLSPDYLSLLAGITPAQPLVLDKETFSTLCETFTLCLKFYQRKRDKLYHLLLKDSCNALVALFLSQYSDIAKPAASLSRFETITKAFRDLLEQKYTILKRPSEYARLLHMSVSYLNECVKSTTGQPVSWHIQQRIVLEAKRMLYHSRESIKEIATTLGYDDYPYFSRLFVKATGITALAFRNKNHD